VANPLNCPSLFISFSQIPSPFHPFLYWLHDLAILRSIETKAEEKRGEIEKVCHRAPAGMCHVPCCDKVPIFRRLEMVWSEATTIGLKWSAPEFITQGASVRCRAP
jgi:hypothetical protein